METFAKEHKLAKLLREVKSTPVLCDKKVLSFFSYVCNGKFAVFQVHCCGITCKWVFFASRMYISISLHRLLENIIDLLPLAQSRLRWKLNVFQLAKNLTFVRHFIGFLFACAATSHPIQRLERQSQKTHILHQQLFHIQQRQTTLYYFFCHYKHTRKDLPSFRSFTVYNSLIQQMQFDR